ncbi:putative flavonoid 3'-monooxygenase [Helianthus annuus]|nr:putative flavonoid 3'-monooxygenase [Helianthus annuus]KAJ0815835.1 putative flavonoid 3'-monooxygenase [Helianthus annuus]
MLGRRVFGDGSGGGDPKADEFKDMVVELMVLAGEFNIGDFIPALDWLDLQGITKKMKKLHAQFDLFLNVILEEHKSGKGGGSGHGDLLSTLIGLKEDADGEGWKLSDVEIKAFFWYVPKPANGFLAYFAACTPLPLRVWALGEEKNKMPNTIPT